MGSPAASLSAAAPLRNRAPPLLLGLALLFGALQLATAWTPPYGLFHDELYYWAGAQILSPQATAAYFETLGQKPEIETSDVGRSLPLYFTGRLEWERFAGEVVAAWEALPAEQRERAVV